MATISFGQRALILFALLAQVVMLLLPGTARAEDVSVIRFKHFGKVYPLATEHQFGWMLKKVQWTGDTERSRRFEAKVTAWFKRNEPSLTPLYLMELARRVEANDPEKARILSLVGLYRVTSAGRRCGMFPIMAAAYGTDGAFDTLIRFAESVDVDATGDAGKVFEYDSTHPDPTPKELICVLGLVDLAERAKPGELNPLPQSDTSSFKSKTRAEFKKFLAKLDAEQHRKNLKKK